MIDSDVLQIKAFSDFDDMPDRAFQNVTKQVNAYLENYPVDLVHSIQPQVTEFIMIRDNGDKVEMTRYTVTVVLRA